MLREMNIRFYNESFYSDGHRSELMAEFEKNHAINDDILSDVVQFCLSSDVVKTLGLSVADLLSLDYHSYSVIKEAVRKENEAKARILEQQQKQTEARQNALLRNSK